MKLREWALSMSGVGLLLAGLAVVLLALQLRSRYEQELVRQIWPIGAAPVVNASPGGNLSPTTLLLGDSRVGQWSFPPPEKGRIVNAGISGATTARILETSRDFLEKYRPDVVVIEAGINDLKLVGMRPAMRAEIVDEAASNLTRLVNLCRSRGCKVLLLLVWPASAPELLRRPVWNAAAVSAGVADLNQRLRSLENPKEGVVVCDILADAGGDPQYRDTLHLEPVTYERLTPIFNQRLQELRSTSPSR